MHSLFLVPLSLFMGKYVFGKQLIYFLISEKGIVLRVLLSRFFMLLSSGSHHCCSHRCCCSHGPCSITIILLGPCHTCSSQDRSVTNNCLRLTYPMYYKIKYRSQKNIYDQRVYLAFDTASDVNGGPRNVIQKSDVPRPT